VRTASAVPVTATVAPITATREGPRLSDRLACVNLCLVSSIDSVGTVAIQPDGARREGRARRAPSRRSAPQRAGDAHGTSPRNRSARASRPCAAENNTSTGGGHTAADDHVVKDRSCPRRNRRGQCRQRPAECLIRERRRSGVMKTVERHSGGWTSTQQGQGPRAPMAGHDGTVSTKQRHHKGTVPARPREYVQCGPALRSAVKDTGR